MCWRVTWICRIGGTVLIGRTCEGAVRAGVDLQGCYRHRVVQALVDRLALLRADRQMEGAYEQSHGDNGGNCKTDAQLGLQPDEPARRPVRTPLPHQSAGRHSPLPGKTNSSLPPSRSRMRSVTISM